MMLPSHYYAQECLKGAIVEDPQQIVVLQQFDRVFVNLLEERKKRFGLFAKWRQTKTIPGLYIWGSVGIGKTFLMDCFYHCLTFKEKKRFHFHQFMRMVHHELKVHQGNKDPLHLLAKAICKKTLVLCLDEFFVSDIADAMLLGRLLHKLIDAGICLIITSNVVPDDLYKNGLQRALFLPAIALLKNHTQVLHIPSTLDYRLQYLKEAGVFYTPHDQAAEDKMEKMFASLTNHAKASYAPIEVCGRKIVIRKQCDEVVWFDFNVLCHPPRSQHDYLELAKTYHTIFLSNIPVISPQAKNVISLFIRLIDVLYDARIRLIFSAAASVENLYIQGHMHAEYARTCSRLREMQSAPYLTK
jgi:cell division protein ZapE